jgi:hypothetical protein
MKRILIRFSLFLVLVAFAVTLSQSSKTVKAAQYCGKGTFACGNLEKNGTCCWSDSQKCCYVSPERGSCYCVAATDKCNRY